MHIAGSPENVADGWLPLERAPARTPTSVGFQVAFASEPNSTLAGGTACILSLSEHATFARLIHCMAAAELGKPAVVYESRTESCPSGFFYGSRRAPSD
jgi:hypothetical protein